MSQRLSLKKPRTWDTFQKDRLQKMSDSIISACILAKSRFDEFLYSEYDKLDTEKFITHIQSLNEENRDEELYAVLQAWVDWLSDTFELSRESIKQGFSRLNKYLWYRRIKITANDLKDEIDWPENIQEERYAVTDDQLRRIMGGLWWKNKAFCLSLTPGERPVELMGTQKKHYTLVGTRYKLEIPYYLTKKRISRTIFLSSEPTSVITNILKKLNDEDFVWTKRKQVPQHFFARYSHLKEDKAKIKAIKRFANHMLQSFRISWTRRLVAEGLDMRYESTSEHKITFTSIRARFVTKALKILDGDIVHAIVGHGAYLQTYQRRTDDEKMELFIEVEPEIMIFDQTKNNEKIKKLKDANSKMEEKINTITDLEEKIQAMEKRSKMQTIPLESIKDSVKKILKENPTLLDRS